ncbi:D-alanyl-D-alanine carboxypeptidase/D-alanyl-D-alanine-endopeptidase [Shewanella sp. SR44-3]|uniref:D-alanyl-D-alanine carboxypeptidase/D-alanyl-D-alanine endopeptidase n=1 Tax=Shewanella sp. SR44-3 TaxID=2760936 RepID=UPI0015F8669A|nr:D-alanyl-D-alanine carboxypeptidase/D-alanyl-D-alanine-endopeptidase [Shewanella sp. SR44-3]MBB1270446.1 D-alanyl-D-alanine carboxypeptidase/D-alanyl-D-alanine-endopeptidase [Shewanella sp. SR44-3]
MTWLSHHRVRVLLALATCSIFSITAEVNAEVTAKVNNAASSGLSDSTNHLHENTDIGKTIADAVKAIASPYSQLAVAIWDPNHQRSIFELNTQKLMQPASVMKLFTAVTALAELGNDYHYQSQIYARGTIINKVLKGDVWIRLSGDPTLTSEQLSAMVAELKQIGIQQIQGQVYLLTIPNEQVRAPGWVWDDLGICYAAPVSRLILDKNCVLAKLAPAQNTQKGKTVINMAPSSAIHVTNQARFIPLTADKHTRDLCQLSLARFDNNQYQLNGCYPSNGAIKLAIAVNQTEPYMLARLEAIFNQHAITLDNNISLHSETPALIALLTDRAMPNIIKEQKQLSDESGHHINSDDIRLIASHNSEPLSVMLDTMLKDSNNLIADSLFKAIGKFYYQSTTTTYKEDFISAAKAQLTRLTEMGIKLDTANVVDGSGLSRYNAISAEQLMTLMKLIYTDKRFSSLDAALPEAGVSGTLTYKRGFQRLLRAKVKAKTGTMLGVSNLAGRLQTSKGDLLFVILENGISPHQQAESRTGSEILTAIMAIYEAEAEADNEANTNGIKPISNK